MADVFHDWAPRVHTEPLEDHFKRMRSVGTYGSKFMYFNPLVTIGSTILIWGFVFAAMGAPEDVGAATLDMRQWVTDIWNWLYMISQNVWIVILLYIMVKYWNLKLGRDNEPQQFTDLTWFAMLFSCGVATGLWYFTAEAMWHYEGYNHPRWMDTEMFNHNTRAEHALMITLFHWGPHGWIPYSLVGMVIAIQSYRRDFPMSMRFTLYPLIGEMCYGILGDLLEILSVCCTLFGVCTSLGLGAGQICAGLVRLDQQYYRGAPETEGVGLSCNKLMTAVIIIVITGGATTSVIVGLKRGIAFLAQVAFGLSFFIIISVLFMEPSTWYVFNSMTSAIGYYFWYLPKVSFHTDAFEELGRITAGGVVDTTVGTLPYAAAPDGGGGKPGWMNEWTIFYWGWWISWGPFCGTFLARISRGRTLGGYIMGSLVIPSIWSFMFMGIFGAAQIRLANEAINAGLTCGTADDGTSLTYGAQANKDVIGFTIKTGADADGNDITKWQPVDDSTTRLYCLGTADVLFAHLNAYGGPGYGWFITITTLLCIVLYFVTSSDSASFVVDMLAANGIEHPPMTQKVYWCITEGLTAIALLFAAKDDAPESALQAVKPLPIFLGLPFTFVLFWVCQSALILCKEEMKEIPMTRKNFSVFLFNLEPASYISFVLPFIPYSDIAAKTWGGSKVMHMALFGIAWLTMLVFLILTVADPAFGMMGAALYFMIALLLGGLRASCRTKLGITGDFVTDCVCGCFAFPYTIGQMSAEDFTQVADTSSAKLENTESPDAKVAQEAVEPALMGKI